MDIKLQKPFLKWVGGKTQIINDIIHKLPNMMNNYHEIFLGGGSVLLAVLSLEKNGLLTIKNKIYAYDVNRVLINVYKNIQSNKDELFTYISHYINEYDSIVGSTVYRQHETIETAKTSKESYYYWVREKFNKMDKDTVECSAIFMFLNKTCFRGMYREGPNGFNVPYGHYKKTPTIITHDELNIISDLIQKVEFIQCDFNMSIQNIADGDFTYLDPPYAPENDKSFVGYTVDGFDLDTHKQLFGQVIKFNEKNIKFLMSNAKVDLVMSTFKKYQYTDIVARRAINSKNPEATTMEVLIYN
jgi:DNA adenine methylase